MFFVFVCILSRISRYFHMCSYIFWFFLGGDGSKVRNLISFSIYATTPTPYPSVGNVTCPDYPITLQGSWKNMDMWPQSALKNNTVRGQSWKYNMGPKVKTQYGAKAEDTSGGQSWKYKTTHPKYKSSIQNTSPDTQNTRLDTPNSYKSM